MFVLSILAGYIVALKSLNKINLRLPKDAIKSDVERYVESKNPSNAAEVEHWLRQYDRKTSSFF